MWSRHVGNALGFCRRRGRGSLPSVGLKISYPSDVPAEYRWPLRLSLTLPDIWPLSFSPPLFSLQSISFPPFLENEHFWRA